MPLSTQVEQPSVKPEQSLSCGDFQAEINQWDRSLENHGDEAEFFNSHGITRFFQGDLESALADFDRALTLNPNYPEAANNRGFTLRSMDNHAAALLDFERAIALRPEYAEAFNNLGLAHQALGDPASALKNFNQALGLTPRLASAPVYHNRGATYYAMGDATSALADFNEALAIDPRHYATYNNRGSARHVLFDLEGAIADFNVALQVTPQELSASIYHNRGGVRITQRDFPAALTDYEKALRIDPNFCVAYVSRGNARYHLQDLGGHNDYMTALVIDAKRASYEVIRKLGADLRLGPVGVLFNCNQHIKETPDLITAYIRRGLSLLLLGRDRAAEDDFDEVYARVPNVRPPGVFHHLIDEAKRYRDDFPILVREATQTPQVS